MAQKSQKMSNDVTPAVGRSVGLTQARCETLSESDSNCQFKTATELGAECACCANARDVTETDRTNSESQRRRNAN